jgi:hypothetical protein
MDLAVTNPNLRGLAQLLGGQSANASGTLYTDQETDDAVNLAYEKLWGIARSMDVGWGVHTSYVNSVADQIEYTLPTDLDGRIKTVEYDADGTNLSSTAGTNLVFLKPSNHERALKGYRQGIHTSTDFYYFQIGNTDGNKLGIVAPPAKTATSNIRIVHEEDLTLLSATTDVPKIPQRHHHLIALEAAIMLRTAIDLPVSMDLRIEVEKLTRLFQEALIEPQSIEDHQIPTAGRIRQTFSTRTGRFTRPG